MAFSIPENTVATFIDVSQPPHPTRDSVHKETGQLQAQRPCRLHLWELLLKRCPLAFFLELAYPCDPGEKGQSPVVCSFLNPRSQCSEQRLQQVSV